MVGRRHRRPDAGRLLPALVPLPLAARLRRRLRLLRQTKVRGRPPIARMICRSVLSGVWSVARIGRRRDNRLRNPLAAGLCPAYPVLPVRRHPPPGRRTRD